MLLPVRQVPKPNLSVAQPETTNRKARSWRGIGGTDHLRPQDELQLHNRYHVHDRDQVIKHSAPDVDIVARLR